MRYQQYKNKMLKVKKTLMGIHKMRFVVIGVTTVIVAGSITLDSIKGNITETSTFELSYRYGEKLAYSGSAVMSDVSYEFRKQGETEWSEEEPRYVGTYQARAKSMGNHGYKYSDISTFEIKPIDTPIKINVDRINFGNDSPVLSYSLLNGDILQSSYKVTYADLTTTTTTASIDMNTIHVLDKSGVEVTDCYNFIPENNNEKQITFNKANITVNFTQPEYYSYTSEEHTADEYRLTDGTLYYDAKLSVTGGITASAIGSYDNNHVVKVLSQDGSKDYSANYNIKVNDNKIVITKANAITVTSPSKEKTYDDKPFDDSVFTYTKTGDLLSGHSLKVEFTNKNIKDYTAGTPNAMNVSIVDASDNDVSGYYENLVVTPGTLKINKKNISITSNSKNFTYDNLEKEDTGFTYDTSSLITGHTINLLTNTKAKGASNTKNVQTYSITRDSDHVDVTDNYNITKTSGDLTFTKKPLKFNFEQQLINYDGSYHNVFGNGNKATLDSNYTENLPTGWTYDVSVSKTMRYYDANGFTATEADVTTHLYDASGVEVTNQFVVDNTASTSNNSECDVTFTFPTSRINKVDLDVVTTDFGNRTYDDSVVNSFVIPASYVSSTGLVIGDTLKVSWGNNPTNNPTSTKDVGNYSFNLNYKVENGESVDVSSCYNWDFNGKENIGVNIEKKDITIHTPNTSKVYDGTNVLPTLSFDDGPLGEKITYDTTKKYTFASANANTYTYPFNVSDIKISLNNRDVTNNYNINFVADGQVTVTKRPLKISQVEDTYNFIYFDNQYHGVYGDTSSANSMSKEVLIEAQSTNRGLLDTQTLYFNNPRKEYNVSNYYYSYSYEYPTYLNNNEYYGTTILDSNSVDVTNNYNIAYYDDPMHFNIIKKKIAITQAYEYVCPSKVFDGSPYDLLKSKNLTVDTYYDIATFGDYYEYTITGYGGEEVPLNQGHKLQATKTRSAILDASIYYGVQENEFDVRVVDENNNDVSSYYDITPTFGFLTTNKLDVYAYCGNYSREYNGQEFTAPYGGVQISEVQTGKQAYFVLPEAPLHVTFDKQAFLSNFIIKASFGLSPYPNHYMAGSYQFSASFILCDSTGNPISIPTSSIEIHSMVSSYKYEITKIDIKITSKVIAAGKEMRYISYGKLATGDKLIFDYAGYDGEEEYDQATGKRKLDWVSVCDYAHTRIMRGSVDVTNCYNLTIVS